MPLAGPVRAAIASMSTDEVTAVRATVEEMLAPFRSDDAFSLPTMLVMAASFGSLTGAGAREMVERRPRDAGCRRGRDDVQD